MSCIWYGKDVDSLAELLKKLVADRDCDIILTTNLHGTLRAGTKKLPLLRVPIAFPTDCLKVPETIPGSATFIGLMVVPSALVEPPPEEEEEQSQTESEVV
jgi:hypothetical protein